jgi:hypothetical protein
MIGVKVDEQLGNCTCFSVFYLKDVNYVTVQQFKGIKSTIPLYHTSDGAFAPILTLKDLSKALFPHGFIRVDVSTLINDLRVEKVIQLDTGSVFLFVDGSSKEVSKRSRFRK